MSAALSHDYDLATGAPTSPLRQQPQCALCDAGSTSAGTPSMSAWARVIAFAALLGAAGCESIYGIGELPHGEPRIVQDAAASESSSDGAKTQLVVIDPDKTMDADPGEGVGVFIEYRTGGHWRVWWTCDTNVSTQGPIACAFEIAMTVSQGVIALANIEAPTGSVRTSGSPVREIDATTTTGAAVHGVTFDPPPGAVLTIDAVVSGERDGRYFFFVRNGKVNGGRTDALSDPLMVQSSRP
jgi:hypothetical protein